MTADQPAARGERATHWNNLKIMKYHILTAALSAGLVSGGAGLAAADGPTLRIFPGEVVAPVSPVFSGMMTEEINHSYDGGLYSELIQNRIFADDPARPAHWSLSAADGAAATMELDPAEGLNDAVTTSLRVEATAASAEHPVQVVNDGYWGIAVRPRTSYRASFYAKAAPGFTGAVAMVLQSGDGATNFGEARVGRLTGRWQKYSALLTTSDGFTATAQGRFALRLEGPGTVWLDLVSLFPPTYHDRPNGNRVDLMKQLAGMQPRFLRFPGGNYLEGSSIATRFPWKRTLGDLTRRPGHPSCWGYRSSDGLGLLEFLEWAEDLGAEPVLAVYAGYSLPPKSEMIRPGADLGPYVADALDEIDYVAGGTNTAWGACRAADGHPEPFKLRYVEIGNEDWMDPSGSYDGRFAQFYDAIKARHPDLQCISTVGNEQPAFKRVHSRRPDLLDEHYYSSAAEFEAEGPSRFDHYDRRGPKLFVGEWAAYEQVMPWLPASAGLPPTPTFEAALGDAAWLTAMERNADLVVMQCYAPMLVNINPGARQWRPNLIGYDGLGSYGSPSYQVIKLFNENRGDEVVRAGFQTDGPAPGAPLNYSVTKDTAGGRLFLKLVNPAAEARRVPIAVEGAAVDGKGVETVLTADRLDAENTLADPTRVVPVTSERTDLSRQFTETLPPHSVVVLQLQLR